MKYDQEYYRNIIDRYGYKAVSDTKRVDFMRQFGERIARNVIASSNLETLDERDKLHFITGIGMNSAPHMGTLSILLYAIELQKRGYYVEVILGDLDVRNARNASWDRIKNLTSAYREFLLGLGFLSDGVHGEIHEQYSNYKNMQQAFLISSFMHKEDFEDMEEDIYDLYKEKGVYNSLTFSVQQSMMLQLADYLTPLLEKKANRVIAFSGIDEHCFASKANELYERLSGEKERVGSLLFKIVPGLNQVPKMSKSLALSGISLAQDENTLLTFKEMFLKAKEDEHTAKNYQEIMSFFVLPEGKTYEEQTELFFYQILKLAKMWSEYENKGSN